MYLGFFEFSGPLIVLVDEEVDEDDVDEVFGNQFVMAELLLLVLLVEFVLALEIEVFGVDSLSAPFFFFLSTFSGSLILMKFPPHLR